MGLLTPFVTLMNRNISMPDYCENKLYVAADDPIITSFHHDIQTQYTKMHKKHNSDVDNSRSKGRCTYWNNDKGYGFILDEDTIYGYNGDILFIIHIFMQMVKKY
eukprot:490649_1